MKDSLSNLVDNLSEINNEPRIKFIDSIRSMTNLLSQSIDKISEIGRKISQIDNKEPDNTFTHNMRSLITSLSKSIDNVTEINKKYHMVHYLKIFLTYINYVVEILINLNYY